MQIVEEKISDLKLAIYNPRKISIHDLGNLIASIQEFGFVEPAVVNKDKTVIGGHQRIRACQQIGIEKIPVFYVDVNKRKEKLLNLALNRIHGEWDEKKLYEVFLELDIKTPDFQLAGFENFEVDKVFSEFGEQKEDDFDLDQSLERNKNPKSKRGEIYELGRHRLMCGDATNREDVEQLMDGKKADMVFTDPPYNVNYDFHNSGMVQSGQRKARFGKIENDCMDEKDFGEFVNSFLKLMNDYLKAGGVFYLMAGNESSSNFYMAIRNNGFKFSEFLLWVKDNFTITRWDYQPKHEFILYGWKEGKHRWFNNRSQVSVLEFKRRIGQTEYPTEKPVEMISYLLKNSSMQNEIIWDLFGGSGSTLIACEQTNRICYMMEIDPVYCDVIRERYEKFIS